jgi:hypothetical protein
MNALIDVLEAREGLVCAVGAGGKKSVLYQLVREHPGPVALTSTAHTTEFPAVRASRPRRSGQYMIVARLPRPT